MLNSDVVMVPNTWVYVRMKKIAQVGNIRESTVDVDLLKQLTQFMISSRRYCSPVERDTVDALLGILLDGPRSMLIC